MKKILALGLALGLTVLCSGCIGSGGTRVSAPTEQTGSSLLLEESRPPETAAPTQTPTVSPVPGPAEEETQAPTEAEPEAPSETTVPAAPEMVKEPVGETAQPGSTVLFVAKARNAHTVSWQLLPPDGTEAQSPQQVCAALPQLKIQGSDQETLTLQNIPMELDGWKVQAEFTGDGGSVRSQAALITLIQEPEDAQPSRQIDPRLYLPVIRNCQFISNFNPKGHTQQEMTANDPFHLADGGQLVMGRLGYVLLDVDGDGAEEMLVAQNNPQGQNYDDNLIVAMFGIRNGKPVKILQSQPDNRHYLRPNGEIYNDTPGDTGNTALYIYALKDCSLQLLECLWCNDYSEDGEIAFYFAPDGIMVENESTRITQSQYDQLYAQRQTILPLPELTEIR